MHTAQKVRILKRGETSSYLKDTSDTSVQLNERNEPQVVQTGTVFYPIDQTLNSKLSFMEKYPMISTLPGYIANKIFKSLGVDPSLDPYIRITNKFDNLMLFHFFTNNVLPVTVSHIRGIVLDMAWDDGDQYPIVCRSFPFTPEYNVNSKHLSMVLKECDKTPVFTTCASEGTLIRIYSVLGQTSNGDPVTRWFISTHKQIDGVKIKWFKFGSDRYEKTFTTIGAVVHQIWGPESFSEYLNPVGTHTFLLSSVFNVIDKNNMKYVGTFNSNGVLSHDGFIKPHKNIEYINELGLTNLEGVSKYINDNKNCTGVFMSFKGRGVSSFNIPSIDGWKPKMADAFIKVINPLYIKRTMLKGVNPGIIIKYIELNSTQREDFKKLYPEFIEILNKYDILLSSLPKYLAACYVERYNKNVHLILPQYDHYVVSRTKQNYNENVTLISNIENILSTSSAYKVYIMINNMIASPFYNK